MLGSIALVAILIGVNTHRGPTVVSPSFTPRDYTEIRESGTLRAVTEYNRLSFHAGKDTLTGFDLELLQKFAQEKGLKLEVTPEMSYEKRIKGLQEGRYDLIATGTVVTSSLKDSLLFTHPLLLSKQVLVQRKKEEGKDSLYIGNQLELAHKTLHLVSHSPALIRIHNLINEIADTIYVREIDKYGPEQLLAMVSEGEIDYAVCDENLAKASVKDYPNLDISKSISFTQFYAWGIGKHSPDLRDTLNVWLEQYLKTKSYQKLYKKYFN
ncbi:putative uncharacterized protein [Bacteroides sp. CAG:714]|nr:putative uncharacterized protein [Bacteroides sp. CAG:714]